MATKALLAICVFAGLCSAQGTRADYERALKLRETFQNLSTDIADPGSWIAGSTDFVYGKSLGGGRHEFLLVDAATGAKRPAFNHARLAESLSKASGVTYTPEKLPFTSVKFIDGGKVMNTPRASFTGRPISPATQHTKLAPHRAGTMAWAGLPIGPFQKASINRSLRPTASGRL